MIFLTRMYIQVSLIAIAHFNVKLGIIVLNLFLPVNFSHPMGI